MFELDCDSGILPPSGSARIVVDMVYRPPSTNPPTTSETIAIYTHVNPTRTITEFSYANNDNYSTFSVTY